MLSDLQSTLMDYRIDSFDFQNVFVIQKKENHLIDIQEFIYSSENGIEFIKFRNDSYLKLSD